MKKNSLKTNILFNVIYQLSATIMPLVTAPYVSRIIGAEGLGVYSYYHSIALYFVYFAMLGLLNYANRTIAKYSGSKDDFDKKFSSIYYLQLITSATILAVYTIYLIAFINGDKIVPVIMILHVLSSMFDVSWLFFGLQEFKTTSIRQLIIRLLSFISLFIFVRTQDDLWKYTLIMSMSYLLSSVTLWVMMFRRVRLVKCSLKDITNHFKPCLILFIPIIATTIYRLMDKIMIGNFCNMSNVGYYENAEKLIFISSGLLGAVATVIMPKMSNLLSHKREKESKQLFRTSVDFCMLLAFAIAGGIAGISKEFIPIFFGDGFVESIGLSMALCVSLPFMIWSMMIRNLYLIPHELDKIYVRSVIIGAAVNFVLNLILIPIIGTYGAIIGTTVADICLAVCQTYPIRHDIGVGNLLVNAAVYCGIGLIMISAIRLFCVVLPQNITGLILEIIAGATIYILLAAIYLIGSRQYSSKAIKQIIRGRR